MLRPGQRFGPGAEAAPNFRLADVEAIRHQLSGAAAVVPVVSASATAFTKPATTASAAAAAAGRHRDQRRDARRRVGGQRQYQRRISRRVSSRGIRIRSNRHRQGGRRGRIGHCR